MNRSAYYDKSSKSWVRMEREVDGEYCHTSGYATCDDAMGVGETKKNMFDSEKINTQYVVVTGDFSSGFQFHGPYESFDAAADSAAGRMPMSWVSVMWRPIEERKGPEWQKLSKR